MRSLVYYVAITIDGQIAASDGSVEAFTNDPDYLADLHRTYADALPGPAQKALNIDPPLTQWDTVLMGRRTYEMGLEQGVSSPYPHLNQFVFSQSLDPSDYADVTVVESDPVEFTSSLKSQEGGRIWLSGGGALATTLSDEIDELIVKVNPVTTGTGTPLFRGILEPVHWQLRGSRFFDSGVAILEYGRIRA